MESKQPYRIAGAFVVAIALSFALGAASVSGKTAEDVKAESLAAEFLSAGPTEYFPTRYVNQATDIEPLPAQF